MFHWFHKALPRNTFSVLLVKSLHLGKKYAISTPVCLSLPFQDMSLIKRGMGGQGGSCNEKKQVEYIRKRGSVKRWKQIKWVPTAITLHRITSRSNTGCILEELSVYIFFSISFFFSLLLCISTEYRIKLKKIHNMNHRLKWNTSSQICKMHLIFCQQLH